MTIQSHPETLIVTTTRRHCKQGMPFTYTAKSFSLGSYSSGGDDPGWRDKISRGVNATNNWEAWRKFAEVVPVAMEHWNEWPSPPYRSYQTTIWEGIAADWLPSQPTASHDSSVLAECVARFNAKLNDELRPLQGLVFLGELRETIGMIKARGRMLLTGLETYHRRARRYLRSEHKGRKALKGLSNLWLEHAFGWSPLFSDIASAVGSLARTDRPNTQVIRAWSEKRTSSQGDVRIGAYASPEGSIFDVWQRSTKVSSAQQVAYCDFSLAGRPSRNQSEYFRQTASAWGLTARDFIPAAWELIPYSFLADYFTNIGDVIGAAFQDRTSIRFGYQTLRTTEVSEYRWHNFRPWTSSSYSATEYIRSKPGSIKLGTKTFKRQNSLTTVPPLTLQYPDFGSLKYANMAALLLAKLRT